MIAVFFVILRDIKKALRRMEIEVSDLEHMEEAAREFLNQLPAESRVVAFHGDMGVGKTTFISALCKVSGVTNQEVNSPTFAIVNHYEGSEGDIYHFDLYRLEGLEQAYEIGAEDYLESGARCFVEWPENCPGLLPDTTVHVTMTEGEDGVRKIKML